MQTAKVFSMVIDSTSRVVMIIFNVYSSEFRENVYIRLLFQIWKFDFALLAGNALMSSDQI